MGIAHGVVCEGAHEGAYEQGWHHLILSFVQRLDEIGRFSLKLNCTRISSVFHPESQRRIETIETVLYKNCNEIVRSAIRLRLSKTI